MRSRKWRTGPIRAAYLGGIGFALAALFPCAAYAHPMGNFSVSHFSGIHVGPGSVEIRYILDMAEIPTFQEMQASGIVPDPRDARVIAYLSQKAVALKGALSLTLDTRPLVLEVVSEDVAFPPGAGGLPTMKIGVVYRAPFQQRMCAAGLCALEYHDGNLPDRAGWKEIVATADAGVPLHSSTASALSRSQELTNYPTDLVNSPPQDLSARLTFVAEAGVVAGTLRKAGHGWAGAATPKLARSFTPPKQATRPVESKPAAALATASTATAMHPKPAAEALSPVSNTANRLPAKLDLKGNEQGTPRCRFTELIASNQWGLWFLLTAALIAAALGGLHALEPGHGKTIVAAYLVGSQGTAAHALWLGLIVTATHTAGVYALGLITLYASRYIVPDHLYPWLVIVSGLTSAGLGLYMLGRRYAGQAHEHGQSHHHGWFTHSHSHDHDQHHHHHAHAEHSHGPEPRHHHALASAHAHAAHGQVPGAHDHPHSHARDHHHHEHPERGARSFSYRQVVTLGVTGGIVPCPAALVVLLSAVALHRVAFGLYLILAFSVGLAAVLISIGLAAVYARRLLARVPAEGRVINRWLPMASAAVITCLGVGIVLQGLISVGAVHFRL